MTTTGHEEEFRRLFAQEAEQRIGDLSSQLLALEDASGSARADLVSSIFREAHTLKGAAAVVGLEEVSLIAHAIESVLDDIRNGERAVTGELIDGIFVAIDGLQALLPDVLRGESRMTYAREVEVMLTNLTAAEAVRGEAAADTDDLTTETPPPIRVETATRDADDAMTGAAQSARAEPAEEMVRIPLSRLDDLVRLVGESAAAHLRIGRFVSDQLGVDPGSVDEVRALGRVLNELQERTMRVRMVPVSTVTETLHRAVRDIARARGKQVRWEVLGGETELDRGVLQLLSDPLLHMVRNAVDHGIETPEERLAAGKDAEALVRLHAMQIGSEVILTITDDGTGIDLERVRAEAARRGANVTDLSDDEALFLVFRSGLSTASFLSDVSGRGVGLDVVRANVESVRGRIEVRSEPGAGTEFRIIVPITLAVLPCLLVRAGGPTYALPLHSILLVDADLSPSNAEGRPVVKVGSQMIPLSDLATTLGGIPHESGPVVVVNGPTRRHAFRVDALVGQRDVVVKEISRLLPRLSLLAGASVEPDGSILLVLDIPGLIGRARTDRSSGVATPVSEESENGATPMRHARLLVVDDALTIRELQRSILERAGYEVITAVDGVDALAQLVEQPVDLVLTDVEMPRLDGFALTEAIREQPNQANVPVLILTSRASEEDRRRGLDAGADGYIVKSSFDETNLLDAVGRLLGGAPTGASTQKAVPLSGEASPGSTEHPPARAVTDPRGSLGRR